MAPVTIVEALPGFGKTTLVAAWAREQADHGAHVVWLRASAELNDVPAFMDHLHRGLIGTDALLETLPVELTSDGVEVDWTGKLELSPTPVIVVVDDAHLLREPCVADALLRMVAITHSIHVVACSDTDHHFHDAAERIGLETNVLRGGDLAIGADQVSAFAKVWGHELGEDEARQLHDLVGGWLLPLRLVLDATPVWASAFATHAGQDFLMTTVLPGITDSAELSVAMRFAVPARLDIELATVLLPGEQGQDIKATGELATAALERQGLLWREPRDDDMVQWRYPKLVRRAFLDELERTQPDAAREAHREVARAMAASGDVAHSSDLLRHARSAGDWTLLARLWTERGWILAGTDPAAFRFAYADVPRAARQELGALALPSTLGDALAKTSDDADWMSRVESLLRHYMQAGADYLRQPRPVDSPIDRLELLTAAMIALRSEGNVEDARKLSAQAARELARARLLEPTRVRTSQTAWFHLQSAITQLMAGNLTAALELATTAYQTGPNTLVGSGAAGLLAAMHAISGQSADARQWLAAHEAVDLAGYWAAGLAELPARLARAMSALDRLDRVTAEAELTAAPLGADAGGLWPLIVAAHTRYALLFGDPVTMLARLDHVGRVLARQLRRGDGQAARQVYERSTIELTLALGEVNRVQARIGDGDVPPWLCTPAARFELITGNAKQAARIAAAAVWRQDVHVRDRLELLVISSLASRELGKKERALEAFRRAHALTLDTGNLEPLLLMPALIRKEMLDATALELEADVGSRLDAMRRVYPESAELIRLSPRELEVLRQIRHHDTSAALARSLSVSVNTVKKQLVSLYAKLGVNDRSSALLRAQRLGLVDAADDAEAAANAP